MTLSLIHIYNVARTLGLPYPGGPSVSQAAKTGDPHYYKLPTPHVEGKYNVSFSGLKTAVVNEVHNAQQRGNVPALSNCDFCICASCGSI